jgi:putative transposase
MPRRRRFATGNYLFHVLNRAVGRQTLFATDGDYEAFQRVLEEARQRVAMRLLAFCVMPNHWHLVLWPREDGDLSEYMRWLTVTHTQRWHAAHGTSGTGPLYQGRFKSFPVQTDEYFLTVCRYVERNALTANLVRKAQRWRWSSLWQWANESGDVTLDRWPVRRASSWIDYVNQPETAGEFTALRNSIQRGAPYGSRTWQHQSARRLGLESTLRPRGRPRG